MTWKSSNKSCSFLLTPSSHIDRFLTATYSPKIFLFCFDLFIFGFGLFTKNKFYSQRLKQTQGFQIKALQNQDTTENSVNSVRNN